MEAVEFSLPELVDLALCDPEVGTVNFNILRILLHGIIQKLGLETQPITLNDLAANHVTHFREYIQGQGSSTSPIPGVFRYYPTGYNYAGKNPNNGKGFQSTASTPRPNTPGPPPERPNIGTSTKSPAGKGSSPRKHFHDKSALLEEKVGRLEHHLQALYALPTNQNILDKTHPTGYSVNDMWQTIQLNNRVAASEAAIQKMTSLIEDLAKELKNVRSDNAGIKRSVKTNSQLEMKVDPLVERCMDAQKAIDTLKKDLELIKNQCKNEIHQLQQATGFDVSKVPTFMKPGHGQQPQNQQMSQKTGQPIPPKQEFRQQIPEQPLSEQSGQPMPGQPGQQMHGQPGQQMHGQPGQQMHGQPGQQMHGQPGQQMHGQPGQQMHGQPGQQMHGQPGQQMHGQPGQQMHGQPGQQMHGQPGQQMHGQPGQQMHGQPGQQMHGQPGQQMHVQPGQQMHGQPRVPIPRQPGQPMPGQPTKPMPGQPAQPMPGQIAQPIPGQQSQPMPVQLGHPISGQPEHPMSGQPEHPMSGQPGHPMFGQPMHPTSGQPGYPMSGHLERPMPVQPGHPTPRQPEESISGQTFPRQPLPRPGQQTLLVGHVGGIDTLQPGGQMQPVNVFELQGRDMGQESEENTWNQQENFDSFDDDSEYEHDSSPPANRFPVYPTGKPGPTSQAIHGKPPGPGDHRSLKYDKPAIPSQYPAPKSKPGLRNEKTQAPVMAHQGYEEFIQKELQKQYGQLKGMQRQLANDIQDKMEFIYQTLLNEIVTQQIQACPFTNLGPEKCTGPGVCHGHEMKALTAAHQYDPPGNSVPGERKYSAGSADARESGKEHPKKIKTPKISLSEDDDESSLKQLGVSDLLNKEMKSMILLPPLEDLRKELQNAGKIEREFDEKDMLEKMGTLWEAVNTLKHNDEAMAVRIIMQDAAIKKLPKGDEKPRSSQPDNRRSSTPTEVSRKPSGITSPIPVGDSNPRSLDISDVLSKDDIQLIVTNLNNLLLDNDVAKQRWTNLNHTVKGLENQIISKQTIIDELNDKADKRELDGKVSYGEFGTAMDNLTKRVQNLHSEVYQKNNIWKHITDHLADELAEKLDKTELAPVNAYFKAHLKALEDRVKDLAEQLEAPDPAGTRRKFLKDMNCISCNRPANISGVTTAPTLPLFGPIPAGHTTASKRAFDLHNMRAQKGRDVPESINLNLMETHLRSPGTSLTQSGKSINDPDLRDILNRYVGGSHTSISNSDRMASFNRARNSNPSRDGSRSNSNQMSNFE